VFTIVHEKTGTRNRARRNPICEIVNSPGWMLRRVGWLCGIGSSDHWVSEMPNP